MLHTGSTHEVTRTSERSSTRGASNLFPLEGTAMASPSSPACCWRWRRRRLRFLLFGLRAFRVGATSGGFAVAGASHRELSTARASVSAIPLMFATSSATAAPGASSLEDVLTSAQANDEISERSLLATTIHPSTGPSTPVRGLPPSRVPHLARPPLVPGQVARLHFPPAPPTSHHPNLSPLLIPTPTSRPPTALPNLDPPARPNMPSVICPTYPPLTSPALPPISLPPRTPHPYNS